MPPDFVPKETETIAALREARLEEKIKKTQAEALVKKPWWTKSEVEFIGLFLISLLGFYVVLPYLGTEAHQTLFSAPLIPFLTKTIILLSSFFGGKSLPFSYSLQIVNLIFVFFFPVTFYLFVKKITDRKFAAFISVLIVSLPFGPFALARIQDALSGRDGPHIASLTLIPLALYSLLVYLRGDGIKHLFFSGISATLVSLTSAFGFLAFLILALITTFSEMLLGSGRTKFARFMLFVIVSIGLSSFWYNPHYSFALFFGPIGVEVRDTILRLIPISLFALPILGAFGFLLFDRKPELQPVFLASFYTISFAIIVLVGGGLFPSTPTRYVPELGLSISLVVGILILKLTEKFKVFNPRISIVAVLVILVVGIIIGSSNIGPNKQVLGLWTDVGKEQVWAVRDNYLGLYAYLGYAVSIITFILLGVLSLTEVKKKDESVGV